uniref:C3H1-type domain-containing protein n=1 Tax=Parastrongyloides trichosuri TaxID=131310 RepID=A0A0N4ZBZ0_PARTI
MFFPTELEFMSPPTTSHFTNRPQSSLSSGSGSNDSGFFASIHGISTEVPQLTGLPFDMDSPHGVSPIPYDGEFPNPLLKCDSPPQVTLNSPQQQQQERFFCENRIQINANVKNVENHHSFLCKTSMSDKNSVSNLVGDYANQDLRQKRNTNMNNLSEISSGFMTEPPTQALIDAASKPLNQQQTSQNSKSSKSDSYKTVMCQAWLENKNCNFGENCRFAHGESELRPIKQNLRYNNKYKTKLCDRYTNTGICPYGDRCLFVHPNNGNAYFSNEKMAEIQSCRPPSSQDRTNIPKQEGASFNNVLVANAENNNGKCVTPNQPQNMCINNRLPNQGSWSPERSPIDTLASCFSLSGYEQQMMFGNDIKGVGNNNNNNSNNNNNYPMEKNLMYPMMHHNPMVDSMMMNPASLIWKNLLHNTYKNNDVVDSHLLTPKLSKDLSSAFGNMSLKEESSIDSGVFNSDILERSIAMLNDFENH